MKKFTFILLIISSVSSVYSQPDYKDFKHYFGIQLNSGITFFNLNGLKNDFNKTIKNIGNQYGIPLSPQHLYPANISWSAYLFWYFSENSSLIIGPEYTSTKAIAGYEDYSGTLDLKSEVKEIYLTLGFRQHIPDVKFIQPLLGFNVGFVHFRYSEDIALNIYGYTNDSDQNEITDFGYLFEPCAGFTKNLDFAVLEMVFSYRIVNLESLVIEPETYNIRIGIKKGIFK